MYWRTTCRCCQYPERRIFRFLDRCQVILRCGNYICGRKLLGAYIFVWNRASWYQDKSTEWTDLLRKKSVSSRDKTIQFPGVRDTIRLQWLVIFERKQTRAKQCGRRVWLLWMLLRMRVLAEKLESRLRSPDITITWKCAKCGAWSREDRQQGGLGAERERERERDLTFNPSLPRRSHQGKENSSHCEWNSASLFKLSLIHIWRCRRDVLCRSRWSPYH